MKYSVLIAALFTLSTALFAKAEGEVKFETCEGQQEIAFENPAVWGVHKFADASWDETKLIKGGRAKSLLACAQRCVWSKRCISVGFQAGDGIDKRGWCNLYSSLPTELRAAPLEMESFKGVATNQRCQVDSKGHWETKETVACCETSLNPVESSEQ